MIATEDELEVAVDAAAAVMHRRLVENALPWHLVDEAERHRFLRLALAPVTAALEALPDRAAGARRQALLELGLRVRTHLCTCGVAGAPSDQHERWCPGSVVDGELE